VLAQLRQTASAWIQVQAEIRSVAYYCQAGRPAKGTPPQRIQWQVSGICLVDAEAVEREAKRRAWA
jgi:hypothetical protein